MNGPAFFALLALVYLVAKVQGVQDCDLICPANGDRPVCGSDGETYQSKCLLRLQKCMSGGKLHVAYNGPCRAPPSCTEERRRVFRSIRDHGLLQVGIFVPKCEEDGSYSPVQCSQPSTVCWCVDKYGQEVDKSRVFFRKPKCRVRPPRSRLYPTNERYSRILKGCSKENRISFNKKVVASFKKEMAKLSGKKGKLSFLDIVDWKMEELDKDRSGYLQHKEIKAIIKKFKKAFTPRKCGKTLFYYCDKDQDYVISRKEWLTCLGFSSKPSYRPDTPKCFKEHMKATELQRKKPNPAHFVPSCNADGTYKSVQCQKLSKYCWCVNSVTGRKIPGSSIRGAKPDCTKHNGGRFTRVPSVSSHTKPTLRPRVARKPRPTKSVRVQRGKKVKECDEPSWTRFSNELVVLFRKELEAMTAAKLQVNEKSTRAASRPLNLFHEISQRLPDTMILAWKFSHLDRDRDRIIREDEIITPQMKKVFGRIRRGRKCSRKLAKSCDFDYSGGLSLNEWRKCLRRKSPRSKSLFVTRPRFFGR